MSQSETLASLIPGSVIHFEDISQIAAFEDLVAQQVDPTMTESMYSAWAGRTALKDLIRPPAFNGTIANIKLIVMDNPYERFYDACDRGQKFTGGQRALHESERTQNEQVVDSFKGFTFVADAKSSGRGVIGQVQTELWFSGVAVHRGTQERIRRDGTKIQVAKNRKLISKYGGASVLRRVARPKIEASAFIELDQTAKTIGFALLQQNMMNPIVQPIRS